MTAKQIKEDLIEQLHMKGMDCSFYEDLIEDYMNFFKMKKELQKDVRQNGVRVETMTGNGFKTSKINEAIRELQRVNSQMLNILKTLDLKTPAVADVGEDDYY